MFGQVFPPAHYQSSSPQTESLTFLPIMAMRALRQRRHSSAVSVMQGFPGEGKEGEGSGSQAGG